jgi:hypothetical protein
LTAWILDEAQDTNPVLEQAFTAQRTDGVVPVT